MTSPAAPRETDPPRTLSTGNPEGETGLDVEARMADFSPLHPATSGPVLQSLDQLLDVTVSVTAELGRVTLSISDVLKLGIGSVLELNRSVSEPVDLMVQGVRLARGEVVVVDDRFAVRIKEVTDPKKRP